MAIDSDGNFVCNGGGVRTLPVWTSNPQALCQASQPAPQPAQDSESSAPGWLKEMFGQ